MTRAKNFTSGGSQAVRLPKSVRSEWSEEFLATLGACKEEIERPPQQPITTLKDPFELT